MTFDKQLIRKWKIKARGLRHDNRLSKRKICNLIAKEYGLSLTTIRYYVYDRKRQYDKQYNRRYDYNYKKLTRHIDSILPQAFDGNPELSLREISDGIGKVTGICLKERTLEKLIAKYDGNQRGSPLTRTESGNYIIKDTYYSTSSNSI